MAQAILSRSAAEFPAMEPRCDIDGRQDVGQTRKFCRIQVGSTPLEGCYLLPPPPDLCFKSDPTSTYCKIRVREFLRVLRRNLVGDFLVQVRACCSQPPTADVAEAALHEMSFLMLPRGYHWPDTDPS